MHVNIVYRFPESINIGCVGVWVGVGVCVCGRLCMGVCRGFDIVVGEIEVVTKVDGFMLDQ